MTWAFEHDGSLDRQAPGPVGVVMGSASDWSVMQHTAETLESLGVGCETRVVSAHRTPDLLFAYAESAPARGIEIIVAGAGGAAHLPGMLAAKTWLPVLGVPVRSEAFNGVDSLLSMVQMPAGVAVGTLAVGRAGAINAALLAASLLATRDPYVRKSLEAFREAQTSTALSATLNGRSRPEEAAR